MKSLNKIHALIFSWFSKNWQNFSLCFALFVNQHLFSSHSEYNSAGICEVFVLLNALIEQIK